MTSTTYHHRSSRQPDDGAQINTQPSAAAVSSRPSKRSYQNRESRKQKPAPFDPDDLCRRLHIVLAEEKAYADRKRRSRANIDRATTKPLADEDVKRKGREVPLEIMVNQATALKSAQVTAARRSVLSSSATKRLGSDSEAEVAHPPHPPEKGDPASYQHVPSVAATQFARTTTHEPAKDKFLVHKLSRKAMKFHMNGPNAQAEARGGTAPDEQARTLHRVREEREKTYNRNQFQHPAAILEATGHVDERQEREVAYRHTFDTHFRMKHSHTGEGDENANPRLSTSSARPQQRGAAQESSDFPTGTYPILTQASTECQDASVRAEDHRVDWSQSDERSAVPLSPTLRKSDSKWTLRGRLSFHRTSKTEKDMLAAEDHATSPGLRSQRSSFFARFKR